MIPAYMPKRSSAPKKHILRGPVFSALFCSRSRICVSSCTSSEGLGGSGAGAGASSFFRRKALSAFTSRNRAKATSRKFSMLCKNDP